MESQWSDTKVKFIRGSRFIAGALLLLSGFAKAADAGSFAGLLTQYGFAALAWAAPLIIVVEVAAGACLFLNIFPKQISLFAMVMVVVFSVAFLYAYLFKDVTDCGCFGSLKMLELSPLGTFIRNAALLLLLFVLWRSADKTSRVLWVKYAIAFATLLVASFLSGYSFSHGHEKTGGQRHPMYERAVKETVLPQLMTTSPDSTYMVFIFSYRCNGCWNYFDNIKRYNESPVADKLVVFAAGSDSTGVFQDYFRPDFEIREADEKTLTQLTQVAPTMFYIAGDTIRHVVQGVILTRYLFEKNYLETN
jgi:uncharacterized membrane protein YphA (DoxX/SURF4 family)